MRGCAECCAPRHGRKWSCRRGDGIRTARCHMSHMRQDLTGSHSNFPYRGRWAAGPRQATTAEPLLRRRHATTGVDDRCLLL